MTPRLPSTQLIWGWQPSRSGGGAVLRSAPTRRSCLSALEAGPAGAADLRWALEAAAAAGPGRRTRGSGCCAALGTRPIGTRRRRPGRSGTRRCGPPSPPASPPSSLVPRPRRCSAASSTTCGRARPGGRARRRMPPRSLTFTSAPRPTRPRSPVSSTPCTPIPTTAVSRPPPAMTSPAGPASGSSRRDRNSTSAKPPGTTCTRAPRPVRTSWTPLTSCCSRPWQATWRLPSSSATRLTAAQRAGRR